MADSETRGYISQSDMPRFSLAEALVIAKSLRDNFASKGTTPINLAQSISRSPSSSGWRMLTGSAVAYGLTDGAYNASQITLASLGDKIVNPVEEGEDSVALLEAALRPSILKAFYEKYDGQKLPKEDIGKNVLRQLGVPQERTSEAWKVMIENAEFLEILTDVNGSRYVQMMKAKDELGKSEAALKREEQNRPMTTAPHGGSSAIRPTVQGATYQDSGQGWSIVIKCEKSLTSETKKKLIEVAELLDEINKT